MAKTARAKAPATVYGEHRSRDLAERRARELERKYGVPYEITERRDARGRYNERGRSFTFERGKAEKEKEYVLNFDYKSKPHRGNAVAVQVHIFAPSGLKKDEVRKAFYDWLDEKPLPEGWRVAVMDWQHAQTEGSASTPEELDKARELLRKAIRSSS